MFYAYRSSNVTATNCESKSFETLKKALTWVAGNESWEILDAAGDLVKTNR